MTRISRYHAGTGSTNSSANKGNKLNKASAIAEGVEYTVSTLKPAIITVLISLFNLNRKKKLKLKILLF